MKTYFKGIEINKVPELAEVCAMDNWLDGLFGWLKKNRPDETWICDVIIQPESPSVDNSSILEIWVGGAPKNRPKELGGVLKRMELSPKKEP